MMNFASHESIVRFSTQATAVDIVHNLAEIM